MKLVTAAEMRALEEDAFGAGASVESLMENAGRAVAETIRDDMGSVRARRVVVLVGPGNNGGDGLVAARHLHDFGAEVTVCLLTEREADSNLTAVKAQGVPVIGAQDESARAEALVRADVVVDAVLGTGRARPLDGVLAATFDKLAELRATVFAIDLPSGLDPDTGAVSEHTAKADVTLTLGFSKIGLHLLPGATYAGRVEVLDIGLGAAAAESIATELLTREWAQSVLPDRPAESNKGTFGRLMIVAGSVNYTGAAALSALGALRAGVGLVTLATIPAVRAAVAPQLPEITYLQLEERDGGIGGMAGDLIARVLPAYTALLIGPGLGQAPGTQSVVRALLSSELVESIPVVIDADALNALARLPGWQDEVKCQAVLTPHPGEMARLVRGTVPEVQEERLAVARRSAAAWRQTVILKGAHTVIARPDGQALVSPFANAALAAAGTGDVLAGAIAGLLAQGVAPFDAAGLAVYLHGASADLYAEDYGAAGLLASELSTGIAKVAAGLRRG